MANDLFDAVYGCLIGGAIGDALGAPVAGLNYWEIRAQYGRVESLLGSTQGNSNGDPGAITGGTAFRQYVALAAVNKEGRITPDDLAKLWIKKGNFRLLGPNERIVLERLLLGMNPWDTGRGADPCGAATVAIAPVGIVNAGDPAQAYQDGYLVASINQAGEEREAAATLAAGVAAALIPGVTTDDVVAAMDCHASYVVRRAIELALDLARRSNSVDDFTERYYEQLTDWRMAQMEREMQPVPAGFPIRARYRSGSSLELLPVSLALLRLCEGDANEAMVWGATFGRDSSGIASIIGCIAGATAGVRALRGDWIDTCERANRDLFEFLEGDPTANFYSTAWRLVNVLKAERQAARARMKMLDRMLDRWP
jgi:ADP-ribosylglycohydrolase